MPVIIFLSPYADGTGGWVVLQKHACSFPQYRLPVFGCVVFRMCYFTGQESVFPETSCLIDEHSHDIHTHPHSHASMEELLAEVLKELGVE